MSNHLITADFKGASVSFTDDGWINATEIADRFGKNPHEWLRLTATREYIEALSEDGASNTGKSRIWFKTRRGNNGGTWLHPDLAVTFARWLDVRFAIWCDRQIRQVLTRTHPHYDRQRLRHEAASSFKVMSQILKLTRDEAGKTSAPHHYSNEARLVNWALTSVFCAVDREALSGDELDLLARLEERNAVLIARGLDYDKRKAALHLFADDWRMSHIVRIAA